MCGYLFVDSTTKQTQTMFVFLTHYTVCVFLSGKSLDHIMMTQNVQTQE